VNPISFMLKRGLLALVFASIAFGGVLHWSSHWMFNHGSAPAMRVAAAHSGFDGCPDSALNPAHSESSQSKPASDAAPRNHHPKPKPKPRHRDRDCQICLTIGMVVSQPGGCPVENWLLDLGCSPLGVPTEQVAHPLKYRQRFPRDPPATA